MRRTLLTRTVPLALVLTLGLGACGSEDEPADQGTSQVEEGASLSLRVTPDGVTPNGEILKLDVGETVTIEVEADEAGSFHVHSTPEQELEFEAGTSTHELSFDRPGVVEMESHDPDLLIARFEVR
jgi:hypothetical protein